MSIDWNRITKELYELSEQLKTLDKEIENLKTIQKTINTGDSKVQTQQESV